MPDTKDNILIQLPSPMGDAILCTPALRAIRRYFESANITFLASPVVSDILSPGEFNDQWLKLDCNCPLTIAKKLRPHKFTHAILFKNSFASALTIFLAKIPIRIGYTRDGRGFFLTEKLYPAKLGKNKFKPLSMVDYYLAIASWLGADTSDKSTHLSVGQKAIEQLKTILPQLFETDRPIAILVPGGAFGPSKCWPADRFAKTADKLTEKHNATVVISVSPDPAEKQIANQICSAAKHSPISLAKNPLTLGQLKALFSIADIVISNDTGPRHIAIALGRKIVTLFGPNTPPWTDTAYENEIQIIADVPCSPCDKPICKKDQLLCMESITVEQVCQTAQKLLEDKNPEQNK